MSLMQMLVNQKHKHVKQKQKHVKLVLQEIKQWHVLNKKNKCLIWMNYNSGILSLLWHYLA